MILSSCPALSVLSALLLGSMLLLPSAAAEARMTLLLPSQPILDVPTVAAPETAKAGSRESAKEGTAGKAKPDQAADAGKKKPGAARMSNGTAPAPQAAGKAPDKGASPEGGPESGQEGGQAPAATVAKPRAADVVKRIYQDVSAALTPLRINEEIDVLIAGLNPEQHQITAMDMPRFFTVYRYDKDSADPTKPAGRQDLLGDIEEILYQNQKAWGANVGIDRTGLYQFTIETRPWWNAEHDGYEQQIVKTLLPVGGEDWGWHLPTDLSFEIVPHTRPLGLVAPALFSARVLVDGQAGVNIPVELRRIDTETEPDPSRFHEAIVTRTTENGDFAAVLNRPGWWCCMASRGGAPLKGPDGEPRPLTISTLFWLYVDAMPHPKPRAR